LAEAKLAVWAGLIAKDRGDFEAALAEFDRVVTQDDLIRARVAFQRGDVLMRLGRFKAALAELDLAVTYSRENEAPQHEQARYLSRRATLYRRRAEFDRAERGFASALEVLEAEAQAPPLEQAFERAKVMDEYALYYLATGRFDEAIGILQHNLDTFSRYQTEHQISATFRLLRSRLHLALAYWCRGVGQPYHPPLLRALEPVPDTADIRHARMLLAQVEHHLQGEAADPSYLPLFALFWEVTSLLAATPEAAVSAAQEALALARHPYQTAGTQTLLATAMLRSGRRREASRALATAHSALKAATGPSVEEGDLGLLAWLSALKLRVALQERNLKGAVTTLLDSLKAAPLAAYHEVLLRAFGEAAEQLPDADCLWSKERRLAELVPIEAGDRRNVRLPDALIARWRQRRQSFSLR
jgi:tetratricopeptide (TPR) repeat protein